MSIKNEDMAKGATATKQPAVLPNYAEWLIGSYKLLVVRWAQLFIIIMCAALLHPVGRLPAYRLYALAFIVSLLGICRSASPAGSCKKVQFWFGVYALFQVIFVFQMAYTGVALVVHIYLDWATTLSTLVPQLLVLDLPPAKSALFLLTHIVAQTAFYCSVAGHSLPLAVIRATCLLAMCGGVFLNFRQRAVADYLHMIGDNPSVSRRELPSRGAGHTDDRCREPGALGWTSRTSALFEGLRLRRMLFKRESKTWAPLIMMVLIHAGVFSFSYLMGINGLPISISQGCSIHAACFCVFLAIYHSSTKAMPASETRASESAHAHASEAPAGSAMALAPTEQPPSAQKNQGEAAEWMEDDANAQSSQGTMNSSTIISTSSSHPLCFTQQHCRSTPLGSSLGSSKAVALRTRQEMHEHNAFVSKLSQSSKTAHFLQAAYRLAVKVDGGCHPDNVPRGAMADLQNRLQKYQRLIPAEPPAVRAGCVVIGFGSVPCSQGSVEDMKRETGAEAKEWALEHGLLMTDEVLSVQACRQSSWVSTSTGLQDGYSTQHSIFVRKPFLEISPSSPEEGASCAFDLTLIAQDPSHLELRGWSAAADAPEEDQKRSLCLLATCNGEYVGVFVKQRSCISNGEWSGQVQVSLPAAMLATANLNPKVLVLELWASGSLVCSHSAVLLPVTGVLAELKEVVGSSCEDSSVFVRDLVVFLHFQAACSSVLEEGQHGHGAIGRTVGWPDPADDEVLLMREVGESLFEYSLENGMCTLAGLLQRALASRPFPPSPACKWPDTFTPAAEQHVDSTPASQEQHDHVHHSPNAVYQEQQNERVRHSSDATPEPQPRRAEHSASPSRFPTPAALIAAATSCGKQAMLAAVFAWPETTQEEEFRAWKSLQNAGLAHSCCVIQVLLVGLGALRRWYESEGWEGTAIVLEEVAYLYPVLPAYLLGALFIYRAGSYTELFVAAITALRAFSTLILGLGVVPIPPVFLPLLKWRFEVLVECLMWSAFEQVRMSWLVPLRILLTIGIGGFYQRSGVVSPYAQAILLNACCVLASKAIDNRYRHLYARAQSAKQVKAD